MVEESKESFAEASASEENNSISEKEVMDLSFKKR